MGAAGGSAQAFWKRSEPRTLIFSCLRDKPLAEMAQILFPLFEQVIVAPIHTARAAALDDLLAAAKATGTPTVAAQSVREALRDGAGSFSGRRGGGVRIGVPGGRGARAAAGRKRRSAHECAAQPVARASIAGGQTCCRSPLLLLVTAVCAHRRAADFSCGQEGPGAASTSRGFWARIAVRVSLSKLTVEGAENLHKHPVAVYATQPYLLHGHAGHLCRAALPVPHPGQERAVADGRSSAGIWGAPGKCPSIP